MSGEPVHIGWARSNGAGEVIFRQTGHPANDAGLWDDGWLPVYLHPLSPDLDVARRSLAEAWLS